jgi:hypothetical protein
MWDGGGERKENLALEGHSWGGIVATRQGFEIGEFRSPPILSCAFVKSTTLFVYLEVCPL